VITFVDNVKVSAKATAPGGPPGSGPYAVPFLAGASGCGSCGGGQSGSGIENRWGGFSSEFAMGQTPKRYSAGSLRISSPLPTLNLATPAGLTYVGSNQFVEIITTSSNAVRQVNAPQALADVVTLDAFCYQIGYYLSSQVGAKVGGVYQLSGSPFVTWKIQNPDASTNTFNSVRITETRGSDVKTYNSVYTASSGSWKLGYPGSLREDEWVVNTVTNGTSVVIQGYTKPGYLRTVAVTTRVPGGPDQFKVKRVYQLFTWGEGLVEETLDPDTHPRTTTYTYYPDTSFQHGPPVQKVIGPDGSWKWYEYDSFGRVSAISSSFGNVTPDGTQPPSSVRKTEYFYGDEAATFVYGSGDDGTLQTNTPRCIIETLQILDVGRRYSVVRSLDARIDIQCTAPGASWNDPSNLFTTNRFYTNGPNQFALRAVVRPDGTMTTYDYITNAAGTYLTNITATGRPDSSFTYIVDGSSNQTVLTSFGYTASVTTYDVLSRVTLSQDTYGNFDSYGRPQQVTHLDGTTEQTYYACCGVDNTTDRDGLTSQYLYDAARRQIGYQKLYNGIPIATTNLLDAAGHALATVRVGTDASLIALGGAAYDLAGQVIRQTNALNGVTAYADTLNGNGQKVSTTTYPDGGVRIETYFLDGSLASVTGSAASLVRYEYGIEDDGGGIWRPYSREIKLDANGNDTSEWTKAYSDMLGRSFKTLFSAASTPYPAALSFFNSRGQMTNQLDADGVSTIYAYSAKGEQSYSILDSNRNYVIDYSGSDRITFTTNDVVADNGFNVRRARTYVWSTSANASNLVSTTETSVDGLRTWNTLWNSGVPLTATNRTFYDSAHAYRITTNSAPDRTYTVTTNQYGRLVSVTRRDSSGAQVGQTIYGYDSHGRQYTATDARNGTTTSYFNKADQVSGIVTPVPASGQSAQVTTNFFDNLGRVIATKLPDNTYITNKFGLSGLLTNTYGSRTYPVAYTYDAQGRMKTMKTWTNFTSNLGAATTTWNYNAYRGWLDNKRYPDNTGPSYTYTPAGRLQTRLWARGANTTYSYNNAGDLSGLTYSDSTPAIGYGYDRRGRQSAITQGSATTTRLYDDAGDLLSESYAGGWLNGLIVTNRYDQYLRRTNLSLFNGPTLLTRSTNSYDSASRLAKVSDGTNSATYSYLANSPLVSQIAFTNNGVQRMVTSKQFDLLNRLTNSSASVSFVYAYNSANQRTRATLADGSYWVYTYDSLGQVISGKRYWSDGTAVAGQQFEYTFDDIGNRKTAGSGGDHDQYGGALHYASYWANSLNQYTSRDVPGYVNVIGSAKTNATVSLWTPDGYWAQTSRKADYFRGELPLNNTTGALWLTITNLAVLNNGTNRDILTNTVGNAFIRRTPEAFGYDADGNLTADGRFTITWDAENRALSFASLISGPSGSKIKVDCAYDWLGRRTQKIVSTWNGSAFVPQSTNRFVYDGWNVIAVLNPQSAVVQSLTWGSDLSGSLQGAGGVGGLLCVNAGSNGVHFFAMDGNGNVAALVKASDGTVSATYEYGPFGELVRATGPMAKANPFRFSNKYQDDDTDMLYYGYRYYSPSTGRWLNRDPLREKGGFNLYGFVRNNSCSAFDPDGQITVRVLTDKPETSCGSASVYFNFILDQPAPQDGYIVQENTFDIPYHSCDSIVHGNIETDHYWEAWLVKAGHYFPTTQGYGYTDWLSWPGRPDAAGSGGAKGKIKFFFKTRTGDLGDPGANPIIPPDPSTGWTWRVSSPTSLDLPSTRIKPTWWDDSPDNGESIEARSVSVVWACCPNQCPTPWSKIVVLPGPVTN